MSKYKYALRCVMETAVIVAVLASIPSLYSVFSCGGDLYYTPGVAIKVKSVPQSLSGARPLVNNRYVSIFTNVKVKWYGDNDYSSHSYVDLDEKWENGSKFTETDNIEYKEYYDGTPGTPWWNDAGYAYGHFADLTTSSNVPHTGTYRIDIGDLAPHSSPPQNGTNDTGDPKSFTRDIQWVAPTNETSKHLTCDQDDGLIRSYHDDTYRVTLNRPFNVSFEDLWLYEVISVTPGGDPCNIASEGFDVGTAPLNELSQYNDILGKSGWSWEDKTGCTLAATQAVYLRASQGAAGTQRLIRVNNLHWKFSPGGGWEDFVSKRDAGNTAKCPDY